MTSLFRMACARATIEQCTRAGVVLLAMGSGVHAVPVKRLRANAVLLGRVQRYRDEIMRVLDGLVE